MGLSVFIPLFLLVSVTFVVCDSGSSNEEAFESDVIQLDDSNFESLTKAFTGEAGIWFVEFYAPWCSHCQRLAPIWERLANTVHHDQNNLYHQFHIAAIDASANFVSAKRFDIRGFPRLKIIDSGQSYEYVGHRTYEDLLLFVADYKVRATPTKVKPVPSLLTIIFDYSQATFSDLTVLIMRRTEAAALVFFVGYIIGLLSSLVVYSLLMRSIKKDQERHQQNLTKQNKKKS